MSDNTTTTTHTAGEPPSREELCTQQAAVGPPPGIVPELVWPPKPPELQIDMEAQRERSGRRMVGLMAFGRSCGWDPEMMTEITKARQKRQAAKRLAEITELMGPEEILRLARRGLKAV